MRSVGSLYKEPTPHLHRRRPRVRTTSGTLEQIPQQGARRTGRLQFSLRWRWALEWHERPRRRSFAFPRASRVGIVRLTAWCPFRRECPRLRSIEDRASLPGTLEKPRGSGAKQDIVPWPSTVSGGGPRRVRRGPGRIPPEHRGGPAGPSLGTRWGADQSRAPSRVEQRSPVRLRRSKLMQRS